MQYVFIYVEIEQLQNSVKSFNEKNKNKDMTICARYSE